jgi:hypothetical protein
MLALAMRESKGSQVNCIKELTSLTMPGFEPKTACDLLATQFGELSRPLEAARVCATDVPCWIPKLADQDPVVRARAAYELGSAGAPEAVAPLVKALSDEQLLVRTGATRALDWLTSVPAAKDALKAASGPVNTQVAAEQGKVQFVKVNEDLKRLGVKLSRL